MSKEAYKIILKDLFPAGLVDYVYRNKGSSKTENKMKVINRLKGLVVLNTGYALSFGLALSKGASQLEKLII